VLPVDFLGPTDDVPCLVQRIVTLVEDDVEADLDADRAAR
jgi:hypothetical protein